jgi:ATP-dependent Clp protease protease subunit
MKTQLAELTAAQTGKTVEQIQKDADRDRWFTAEEALKYGFIDKVVTHESEAGPRADVGSTGSDSKDAGGKA